MDGVNKTLYIPLFGKSYVSKRGLFIKDKMAEQIWDKEGFLLKGKSKSKWLAFYMGIRAGVFDDWVKEQLKSASTSDEQVSVQDTVVIHIGCGLDGRVLRIGEINCKWYDVDFFEVIEERKRYYTQNDNYKMIAGDVRDSDWLQNIDNAKRAIVIMEGVSMYLTFDELLNLTASLSVRFEKVSLLMDCYTNFAVKMSKYKNPINDVGAIKVYGIDNPTALENGDFFFVKEGQMTPKKYIDELSGFERLMFKKLYAGSLSKKLYRLFEYKKCKVDG